MAWIELTQAKVQTRLSGPELEALESSALADDQDSPLTDIITGVVKEVRGYIAACAKNILGEGETIPEALEHAALAMIRFRLATRLPDLGLLSTERNDENKEALQLMREVAACRFSIEKPTDEDDEERPSPRPLATPRTREFTREDADGI